MFNFPSDEFNGEINNTNKDSVEPEEVFLDKSAREEEKEKGISEQKMEVSLPVWTLRSLAVVVFGILILLLGRSFQIQVFQNDSYHALAQRNLTVMEPSSILRGVMYDQDGEQLVFNDAAFKLQVNREKLSEDDFTFLVEELGIENLKEKLSETEDDQVVIEDINHETAVLSKVKGEDFSGIEVKREIGRRYEYGPLLSHVLGYTGKVSQEELNEHPDQYTIHDYTGKTGLEKYYEDDLAKERGEIAVKKNAEGEPITDKDQSYTPGDNLELWIDQELQKQTKKALEEVAEDVGVEKASAVALDPSTGGVLAMVNIPSYDNNLFSRIGKEENLEKLSDQEGVFLNRTISASYPVGSTIKPLLAAAALEEDVITPQKEIYSPGYLDIPNPWNPSNSTRMQDFEAYGWVDMKRAIAVSSNVYFYQVGGGYEDQEGLGAKRMKKYLELFGWGSKTGVDLPNEKTGQIPGPSWKMENLGEPWTLGDSYNLAIGQGYLTTTPLQVAVAYSSLINGGEVLEPKVVRKIFDDNKEKQVESPVVREDFISPKNLEEVKEGMHLVTASQEGTASILDNLPVSAGAKTGTAQIPQDNHYHNWIAAFGPYEDPEIVLVVMFEEVEGMQATAGRTAYKILNWYFNNN